jgi:ankyrin repeat protein
MADAAPPPAKIAKIAAEAAPTPPATDPLAPALDCVQRLVAAAADADKPKSFDGATPLHVAAQEGNDAVARLLLARNAAVDKADEAGTTPLHIAALNGHEAMARLLLEHNAAVDQPANNGATPGRHSSSRRRTATRRWSGCCWRATRPSTSR